MIFLKGKKIETLKAKRSGLKAKRLTRTWRNFQ